MLHGLTSRERTAERRHQTPHWATEQHFSKLLPASITLLEENVGRKLHDTGLGNDFLNPAPKAQATEEKMDELDFVKMKNSCAPKDIINRVKKQYTDGRKYFKSHI